MNQNKILLIEDDKEISEMLKNYIRPHRQTQKIVLR